MRVSRAFSALGHRNFRLFFIGQCVSLIGTWMQNIGQQLLVLQLTNSAFKLGLVSTIQFLPVMLFSLFAGAVADKFPKRRVLIFTQSSLMALAAVLALLTYFNAVQYWHVLVLAALLGLVNTLDMPTRLSFFVEMVGREDLMNAVALNSTIFNLARILGPAVAGVLVGWVGIAACFGINALSFVAVITGLAMMDVKPVVRQSGQSLARILHDIPEGLRYVAKQPLIVQPLILLAVCSIFVMNFTTVLPVYSQNILRQDAAGYGFLMACMGVGSFLGALRVAAASRSGPRTGLMVAGAAGMALLLAVTGLVGSFAAACALITVMGFCAISFTTQVQSTIQLNASDEMRARVISIYSLVFGGMVPFGGLYAGTMTERAGAPVSMLVSGVIGLAASAFAGAMLLRKNAVRSGTQQQG